MNRLMLMFLLSLALSLSAFAQQAKEDTVRRLRRKETRTTTTDLYKDRDTIVAMLKSRLAILNRDSIAAAPSGSLASYFSPEAAITGPDGSPIGPADFQNVKTSIVYRNYRLRNLKINEGKATATESFEYTDPSGPGASADSASTTASSAAQTGASASRKATINSELRKEADGRWLITQMRITSR